MRTARISTDDWEGKAEDRSTWRTAVREGVKRAEESRLDETIEKRARRKAQKIETTEHVCKGCKRDCHSRIGLLSHTRKCNLEPR